MPPLEPERQRAAAEQDDGADGDDNQRHEHLARDEDPQALMQGAETLQRMQVTSRYRPRIALSAMNSRNMAAMPRIR